MMSAVALGRLKAKAALGSLRANYTEQEQGLDPVSNACGWAVAQITGEALAAPRPVRMTLRSWFLTTNR